jgi:cell division protein FtsN
MSDMTFPQPNAENVELAAANRRLTTAILGMTLLMGLIACLSYLAGRTVTHLKNEEASAGRQQAPSAPVVINPIKKPSPSVAVVPSVPVVAPAVPTAITAGNYLQVGLMNPSADRSMEARLTQLGYKVQLVPMENSAVSRVLVGPIASATEQKEISQKLQADGFQFFPRRL